MYKKRGQAGNIATVIAIIALFMIVYVLLLPQEARDELLNREDGVPSYMQPEDGEELLVNEVGKVDPLRQSRGTIHTISGANLFSHVESEIITLANEIVINKGLISDNSQKLVFYLDYPGDVEKAELYLIVDRAIGNLVVSLNGYEIYNNDVGSNTQELVELPLGYLEEYNTIELKSASPGTFWKNAMHELKSVRLRKQVEVKNKEARKIISIPASEMKDLEKAIFGFNVYCSRNEEEPLNIRLNGKLIYSDVPFCNLRRTEIEIDSSYIISGVNTVDFESEGDYTLEEVEWESLLRGERASEYAFSIDDDDYKEARRGLKDVFIVFDFALSDERKIMDFYVNDRKFEVDTEDDTYVVIISDYLEKGSNLVRLRPRNSFEIVEMRVELE